MMFIMEKKSLVLPELVYTKSFLKSFHVVKLIQYNKYQEAKQASFYCYNRKVTKMILFIYSLFIAAMVIYNNA